MNTNPTETARYRNRTPEVEAVQWTGTNADALRAFAGADFEEIELDDRVEDPDKTAAVREADHGTWRGLAPGDWVVRLDEGLYEFSAADFAERYEPVSAVSEAVPPTGQTDDRDRIAAALYERERPPRDPHWAEAFAADREVFEAMADAIMPVLPPPADRAAAVAEASRKFPLPARAALITYAATTRTVTADALTPLLDAHEAEVRGTALREAAQHLYTALFPAVYDDMGQKAAEGVNRAVSELRRLAAETPTPETQDEAHAEKPPVCEGFQWIGQSFATCDRCQQPAWDHVGEDVAAEGAGPFDTRRTVRPWAPGEADRIRAKWGTPAAVSAVVQPDKETDPRTVCVCGHTRGEHIAVSGRLLCDECDPGSTDNLTCTGFDAL